MNSIEEDALIECNLIYKGILDEAELNGLTGTEELLFINAYLRNQLEDAYRQLFHARRKGSKASKEVIEARNEEILYLVTKGRSQKGLAKKFGMTQPGINRLLMKTIKSITKDESEFTVTDLLKIYKVHLEDYFSDKKLRERYMKRFQKKIEKEKEETEKLKNYIKSNEV